MRGIYLISQIAGDFLIQPEVLRLNYVVGHENRDGTVCASQTQEQK